MDICVSKGKCGLESMVCRVLEILEAGNVAPVCVTLFVSGS